MPADYQSAAEALAVSPSRLSPSLAPWSRRSDAPAGSRRRLSEQPLRLGGHGSHDSFASRAWASVKLLNDQIIKWYFGLSIKWRIIAVLATVVIWVVLILFAVYSHDLFVRLAPVAKSWRELPAGWLIMFLIVAATSFPPVIGYSTANTVAGFVYGFPLGWPIVASGTVIGSLLAFLASRTVLSTYVDRVVGRDRRFVALGQVLRREGILYLTAIRFCPLPYSLSNGFLATIPSISPVSFALATALASPKLLVHVFIGSRLAVLAEKGDKMGFGDKAINWLSMLISGAVGIAIGLVIYRRTMARAAELAREDTHASGATAEEGFAGINGSFQYDDDAEGTLMDPEDAAALMSGDDVSLWETQVADYRDDDGQNGTDDDDDGSAKKQNAYKDGMLDADRGSSNQQ
jgi:uncharacterized membrane protein YdjX (TVP38/TMEM64 family)